MRALLGLGIGLLAVTSAQALELRYSSTVDRLSIAAGASASLPLTVAPDVADGKTYYLWFVDQTGSGATLPLSWLTAQPATAFLGRNPVSSLVTVQVPAGTPSGVYRGVLYSKAMAGHGYANPGSGWALEVSVPYLCASAPTLVVDSIGPAVIWSPNHDATAVTATGRVSNAEGCASLTLGYSIDDEYGLLSGTGTVPVAVSGDVFTAEIPVEASRLGQDKDGRLYRIQVFASNETGTVTTPVFEALVPHDQSGR